MSQTILFTILGALILLWGGILAIIKWIAAKPDTVGEAAETTRWIEKNHLLGLGGYITVVCGVLIYLVLHTAIAQQATALKNTRNRLNSTVDLFRDKLGELTEKLMGEVAKKADFTMEKGELLDELHTERSQHRRTNGILADVRSKLAATEAEREREAAAHGAYVDSMNTARALHRATSDRLGEEEDGHWRTRQQLGAARDSLSKTRRTVNMQEADIARLRKSLGEAQARTKQALKNEEKLLKNIAGQLKALPVHQEALGTLQASVDSIYRKVLKRHRIPLPQ